jgi:hypothetical protein
MTWLDGFEAAILDLVGDPFGAAPQRKILAELARNIGVDAWTNTPAGGETATA